MAMGNQNLSPEVSGPYLVTSHAPNGATAYDPGLYWADISCLVEGHPCRQ